MPKIWLSPVSLPLSTKEETGNGAMSKDSNPGPLHCKQALAIAQFTHSRHFVIDNDGHLAQILSQSVIWWPLSFDNLRQSIFD